jgi:hypothetical protein
MVTKEVLQKFCSDDPTRENIAAPWSSGAHSYATSGHILIRVPRIDDIPERGSVPNAEELFVNMDRKSWFPMDAISLPEPSSTTKECPECKGLGAEERVCPECYGSGTVDFSNRYSEYEVDCRSCDGEGKIHKCDHCGSDGKITTQDLQPTEIGGHHFQARYLRLLKSLPGCKVGPNETYLDVAAFTFDGGDGLLMPMMGNRK